MGERDLGSVQRAIAFALQRPSILGPEDGSAFDAIVLPSHRGLSPAQRIEIYREQYWLRHLKNLSDDYPTLTWALGGASAFEALAIEYLGAHPPSTWDLQRLGADMPSFVAGLDRAASDPVLPDAAALDWAFMEVFDAPDAPPFDPRLLASTPEEAWPAARVILSPSLRLLSLRSPLHDVRTALRAAKGEVPRPAEAMSYVAVWRDAACTLRSVAMEAAPFALLSRLSAGEALGPACEAVAASAEGVDVAGELGSWFATWVQQAWIAKVEAG
jgi:hypothetical protein